MQLETYLDFSIPNAIRLQGHRIGLEHVIQYYLNGYSAEDICQQFPGVSLDKVYVAITYFLTNRADVEAYMREIEREKETAWQATQASALTKRLQAIKEQRENSIPA